MFEFSNSIIRTAPRGLVGAVALALTVSLSPVQGARPFSDLVSTGDSLSDLGRFYEATGNTLPPAPYFDGRFCNGPVWIEYLAEMLDMDLDPGSQFAFGGSLTGDLNYRSIPPSFILPGFAQQVDAVLANTRHRKIDSKALYTVWVGANDFFAWMESGNPDPTPMMEQGVANTITGIADMAAAGARNFVVLNIPDLGKTPEMLSFGPAVSGFLSYLSASYNAVLDEQLDLLEQDHRLHIVRIDIFGLINDMAADPAAYGLTNVSEQALLGLPGANPDEYLFWDGVHPTTTAQEIVAEVVFEELCREFRNIRPPGQHGKDRHALVFEWADGYGLTRKFSYAAAN